MSEQEIMKEKIEKILDKMGIPLSIKGYRYLIQAVILLNKNEKISSIYCEIAKVENTTAFAVERAIRHACIRNEKNIKEYLNLNCKISNSVLVKSISRELERSEGE